MSFVIALAAPTASATLAALRGTSVAHDVSATVGIASASVHVPIEVGIPVGVEIAVDVLVLIAVDVQVTVDVRIRIDVCICIDARIRVDVRVAFRVQRSRSAVQ